MVYWNRLTISPLLLWEIHTYPDCTNSYLNRTVFTAEHVCRDNFFVEVFSSVTAHHFCMLTQCPSSADTANPLGQKCPIFCISIYVYIYVHTGVYIWHVCTHTGHPSFSIKVMADWHHRSLCSFPLYFTWEAEVPRRSEGISFTSRSSSHFPAQLAMWDGTQYQPDWLARKLKCDMRYINTCCVLSTTSWILFQRPPGPVRTSLGTGSGPSRALWIQPFYPHRHTWHHSVSLQQALKEM